MAVIALVLPIALLAPHVASADPWTPRCSFTEERVVRHDSSTYLLGVPLPDTVLAGAGPVAGRLETGHEVAARAYGQLVRVEELGGADSATVAAAFEERGNRLVLVVPWAYRSNCGTIPWTGSFVWSPVGVESHFRRLRPRPRTEWVDGIPTFDALDDSEPYYPASWFASRRSTPEPLTAAQSFALQRSMPSWADLQRDPETELLELYQWELSHSDLARRYPAPEALLYARTMAKLEMSRRFEAQAAERGDTVEVRVGTQVISYDTLGGPIAIMPHRFRDVYALVGRVEAEPETIEIRVGERFDLSELRLYLLDTSGQRLGYSPLYDRWMLPGAAAIIEDAVVGIEPGTSILELSVVSWYHLGGQGPTPEAPVRIVVVP